MTAGSGYFHGLGRPSQERCMKKLEITGLTIKDNPYSPSRSGEWSLDICYWTKIEYVNFFSYFIAKPGTFTFQQLASWRQL